MFFGGGDFEEMFGHGGRGGGGPRRGGGEPDTKLYEALGVPKSVRVFFPQFFPSPFFSPLVTISPPELDIVPVIYSYLQIFHTVLILHPGHAILGFH